MIFLRFAALQCLVFFLATLNMRWTAKGKVLGVLSSDAAIVVVGYLLTKSIAGDASGVIGVSGCVVGGCVGSYLALRMTKDAR